MFLSPIRTNQGNALILVLILSGLSALLVLSAWQMIWTDHKMINQWREHLGCERELDHDLLQKEREFLSRTPSDNDKLLDFIADTVHFAEHEGVSIYHIESKGQNACEGHQIGSYVARRILPKNHYPSFVNSTIKLSDSTWVQIQLLRSKEDPDILVIEVRNYETKGLLRSLSVPSRATVEYSDFWLALDSSQKGYADRVYVGDSQSLWAFDLSSKFTDWILPQEPLYSAPQGWTMSKPTANLDPQGEGLRLYFWIRNSTHSELLTLLDSSQKYVEKSLYDSTDASQKILSLDRPVSDILLRQNFLAFHTNTEIYVLNPDGLVVEKIPFINVFTSNKQIESSISRVHQLGDKFIYEVLSDGIRVASSEVLFDSEKLGRRTYNHNNVKASY